MSKGCLVVMKGEPKDGLYALHGSTIIGSASVVEENADKTTKL